MDGGDLFLATIGAISDPGEGGSNAGGGAHIFAACGVISESGEPRPVLLPELGVDSLVGDSGIMQGRLRLFDGISAQRCVGR